MALGERNRHILKTFATFFEIERRKESWELISKDVV